jgi:hypothetical protein
MALAFSSGTPNSLQQNQVIVFTSGKTQGMFSWRRIGRHIGNMHDATRLNMPIQAANYFKRIIKMMQTCQTHHAVGAAYLAKWGMGVNALNIRAAFMGKPGAKIVTLENFASVLVVFGFFSCRAFDAFLTRTRSTWSHLHHATDSFRTS